MTRHALALAVAGLVSAPLLAAEGMWTLDNLPLADLQASYGFAPDDAWVTHAMRSSVRLAGGCSGSFVSPDGLVLTNAHCIVGCVQGLSSPERDLQNGGFVANARGDELQCPAEELNVLLDITDVSDRLAGAVEGRSGQDYVDARNAEKSRIESECVGDAEATTRCDVVELYNGGQQHLYRYHRYSDVRLVFSPEYSVGFFGGDPDNFNFPRYNLDAGLLRAYEDGRPASIEHHFALDPAGAEAGELVMVTGHPGRTQRQLTVAQLETVRDVNLINNLLWLAERRAMLGQYGRIDDEAARQAQSDLTFTDNSYKVFRGQLQALLDPAVFAAKRAEEAALREGVDQAPWDDVAAAQQTARELAVPYMLLEQGRAFDTRLFTIARTLLRGAGERAKPNDARLPEFQDAGQGRLRQTLLSSAPIHPEFEIAKLTWSLTKLRELLGTDDPLVKDVLGDRSPAQVARSLVEGSTLADVATRERLWDGGERAVAASEDPFIALARLVDAPARALRKRQESEVASIESRSATQIARVRFDKLGTSVYPDATFTLRLSYGEVQGWEENGKPVAPFTEIAGVFARNTGAEPYALPQRWLDAESRLALDTRFNFVSSNDIIGGNSGSPVIDRDARVVGLAFDGNIHSLGGSFWYDPRLNRTVSVHSGAIVEALKTVYGADTLVDELLQE
ncbi:S46 family peptidase [Luteimonas sp. BDR2-5]|uniref:S46 family peptidase n=1 Tax=Proluteimonas luteida TaxID=2878685 RepID=UPI001E47BE45|nr:S46 family peptidase [Luteimonas sp. BDR2-5]MCD9027259.1 S46 family peptidase [Luteimonas sp. BDR2-5]